jgi:tetratricopeptide (TPR) repeat protein
VPDLPRLEALRRRIQKDPASIVFAQLAEEYRRASDHAEAIRICRAGLAHHPGYLSAHVTLGRALLALEQFDAAQGELDFVLRAAPDNLSALRGVAEIHHRRGHLPEALAHYRAAWAIASHDRELAEAVADLERQLRADDGSPGHGSSSHAAASAEPPPLSTAVAAALRDDDLLAATPAAAPVPTDAPPLADAGAQARSWPPADRGGTPAAAIGVLEAWLSAIRADRARRDARTLP